MKNPPEIDLPNPDKAPGDKIRCYFDEIPAFVSAEMDRCYGALYSSISYLKLAGKLSHLTCTYVAFSGHAVRSIFLFERDGCVLKVLNGAIRTEQAEVEKFANYIFAAMPDVSRIAFTGVSMGKWHPPYPCQRFLAGEDIVIALAGAAEEYDKRLGKSTRKSLRRHASALFDRHPSACYKVFEANSIDPALIGRVVAWNRERMTRKNKVSAYKDEDVRCFTSMVSVDGVAGTLAIGDRVCATTICCRVGLTYYMIMTGHDSAFDELGVGMLCRFWTALECLRLKAGEINLMCGRLPYKYSLLGESRKYDCLTIYRNHTAYFRNFKNAVATALRGYAMEARFALLDCERQQNGAARLVARAIGIFRSLKRHVRQG